MNKIRFSTVAATVILLFVFCAKDYGQKKFMTSARANAGFEVLHLIKYNGVTDNEKQTDAMSVVLPSKNSILKQSIVAFQLPNGSFYYAIRSDDTEKKDEWTGILQSCDFSGPAPAAADREAGQIFLNFSGEFVSGGIYTPGGSYEIFSAGGSVFIREFRSTESDSCLLSYQDDENRVGDFPNSLNTGNEIIRDSGDRIDVLVVYTAEVENGFGGRDQTLSYLQSAVMSANLAFTNSRILTKLNFVSGKFVNYSESGNTNSDLSWLKASNQVAQMRQEFAADMVVLIVEQGNACGSSQLLTSQGPGQSTGFSVVKRSCAVAGTAFAHEIAHSFGADHDPSDSPVPPSMHILPYAFEYSVSGQFITLMGTYSNTACPEYCRRIISFSNPKVTFNGIPTGVENNRDNAGVINRLSDAIANLRVSPKTVTLVSPNQAVTWRRNMPRKVEWTSSGIQGDVKIEISRDGGMHYETLVSRTENDGQETVTIKGVSSRQARIRVKSLDDSIVTDTSAVDFQIL